MADIAIIGGGLAGTEAAWQVARAGFTVALYEMRPGRSTPAHRTGDLAELVCSNSLRSASLENAVGLLKEEMRRLDSLIIAAADENAVPAGGGLAVDRRGFSQAVADKLLATAKVEVIREEVASIPAGLTIIATGPLTEGALGRELQEFWGNEKLYFYDAAAPVVTLESIDFSKAFFASRYGKGEASYINCPLTREEYDAFYEALVAAKTYPVRDFEKPVFFEGCMPIEEMARRGRETMAYGPLKPVGLTTPEHPGPYAAVVQLRQDNAEGSLYNLVGFQTHLLREEQERVLRLIPGLENCQFARYGLMHRNTYINSPLCLKATMEAKEREGLFFAGQLTGVEGYVESAANGLLAGVNCRRRLEGREALVFPPETAIGALAHYITTADPGYFQPMNVNFGLLPPLAERVRKRERRAALANRALKAIAELKEVIDR